MREQTRNLKFHSFQTENCDREGLSTFLRQTKRIAAIFTATLRRAKSAYLCLLLLVILTSAALAIPYSVPIKFGTDSIVELSVFIKRHRVYYLDLTIHFNNAEERKIARAIVGEATNVCKSLNNCGESTSFKITIRGGEHTILHREIEPYGHYAFTASEYRRNLIVVPLLPGSYKITVEPIKFGSRLQDVKSEILLTADARARDLGD